VPTALATRDEASYTHYDVIFIMTSFATELAPLVLRTYMYVRTDTLPRLMYKDFSAILAVNLS